MGTPVEAVLKLASSVEEIVHLIGTWKTETHKESVLQKLNDVRDILAPAPVEAAEDETHV